MFLPYARKCKQSYGSEHSYFLETHNTSLKAPSVRNGASLEIYVFF